MLTISNLEASTVFIVKFRIQILRVFLFTNKNYAHISVKDSEIVMVVWIFIDAYNAKHKKLFHYI